MKLIEQNKENDLFFYECDCGCKFIVDPATMENTHCLLMPREQVAVCPECKRVDVTLERVLDQIELAFMLSSNERQRVKEILEPLLKGRV